MAAPERWSNEQIIQAIEEWARRHGRAPQMRDWRHASDLRPQATTVLRHFGSWNAALAAAGYGPVRQVGYWTDAMILDAIRRWEATYGRPPVTRDWVNVPRGYPPVRTVTRRFGSWSAAVTEAGLTPARQGRRPTRG